MTDIKANLRRHALERRDLVTAPEAHAAAEAVCRGALALLDRLAENGRPVVSAYWPIRSEINTRLLIDALCARGFPVALPAMTAVRRPLLFRAFVPSDELVKGPFGLSEPSCDKVALDPEILFAPLVAFDRGGHRLGYGGGIYDATLSVLRADGPIVAVGLAYAIQEAEAVPAEAHDQKLDFVITERETLAFGSAPENASLRQAARSQGGA
jgi:5-formyltetrahydrofolate cyclo-ligase